MGSKTDKIGRLVDSKWWTIFWSAWCMTFLAVDAVWLTRELLKPEPDSWHVGFRTFMIVFWAVLFVWYLYMGLKNQYRRGWSEGYLHYVLSKLAQNVQESRGITR